MTKSVSTRWVVEVYPFNDPLPTKSPEANFASGGASIVSSVKKGIDAIKSSLAQGGGVFPDGAKIESAGVTGVSIQRSKTSPNSQAVIDVAGPLPDSMIPGSWVIISTFSSSKDLGESTYLMRFIGQIYSIDVQYVVEPSGLKRTVSQVKVREWSYALTVPVRYDILSIEASVSNQKFLETAISSLSPGKNPATELTKIMENAYTPFEMAHITLKLIGAINSKDMFEAAKSAPGDKFPSQAVTMPSIPPAILERLGIKGADPKNPFSSGFVTTLSGMTAHGVNNGGDWNGMWLPSEINLYGLEMKTAAQLAPFLPVVTGIAAFIQQGVPAWDILNHMCENSLNEVFTDMWFEQTVAPSKTGGITRKTVAKPVIVIRDKPFLLEKLKDNPPEELGGTDGLSQWTLYDNIPRIAISSELIFNFRINNNITNSPNYIRPEYTSLMGDRNQESKAALGGFVRLTAEMERFGGNYETAKASFMGLNLSRPDNANFASAGPVPRTPLAGLPDGTVTYFKVLKNVFTLWHAYDYRMASGVLQLKDDNIPISVGMNAQFKIGNYTLVGHIENVEYHYTIREDGLEETYTYITLRRICQVLEDGSLDFIAPTDFGNLYYAKPSSKVSIAANISKGIKDLFA
jgi:hypothetical protein